MLTSRLFLKIFATIVILVVIHAALLNYLSIPLINRSISDNEENAARTILQNVHDLASRSHSDIEAFQEYALDAHRRELRSVILSVESHLRSIYNQYRAGKCSEAEARKRCLEDITAFRYAGNNYIFIVDYQSRTLAHPLPGEVGRDMSTVKDARGLLFIPATVRAALSNPEGGFSRYWWCKLENGTPLEKLTFAKTFAPWGWVIGTGVYIDDVEKEVARRKERAVNELREKIRGIRIANTGYLFIFDSKKRMIIHPNHELEGTDISGFSDHVSGRPLAEGLMEAAWWPDYSFVYKWDKPTDKGNYVHEKVAWVKYFKGFDWYIASSVYLDELGRSAGILRGDILRLGLLVLLLSIGIGYFFVRRLVRPIETLSRLARKVQTGDLTVRCGISRNDEIGDLARSFDAMIDQLRKDIETLDGKVRERTLDLEKACTELRQLDEMKSSFLSTVSHELRTPMTSVLGFACIIRKMLDDIVFPQLDRDDPRNARTIQRITENLGIVVSEGQRLTDLVNDFLDLSKMEAGKIDWKSEPLDLGEVVRRAASASNALFSAKALPLVLEIEEGLPRVTGDPDRLIQVLINLFSNAVKFTERGAVTCRVSRNGTALITSVVDTGAGIDPKDHHLVFEKFKQVGDTLTGKPRGTGLGLPICRQIVEHHGGSIWVESEPGRGSTFAFSLPIPAESTG
ncbi:MAG: cache domain-containing protein [Acidobacteria bacterium]|nr:cache domain-containing protein [Acidobacteriota bacterium]